MKFVIGDIHGNATELRKLFDVLSPSPQDELIFLGDYLDKGTETRETLELLTHLSKKHSTVFIKGNHDFAWEQFLLKGDRSRADFPLKYGGIETLQEYGNGEIMIREYNLPTLHEHLNSFINLLPHMRDYILLEKIIALHAGLTPEQLSDQNLHFTEKNYFVRQEPQDVQKYLGKYTVVGGHTFFSEVPTVTPNYINLDLGAAYGKFLGALCVEQKRVIRSDGAVFPLSL